MTTPDWLTRHDGSLRPDAGGRAVAVYLGPTLHYVLSVAPVAGMYSCRVKQTINGKRLDRGAAHPTPEEALRAGLEELRVVLGW